jgi:RNA polymerase sigma factor (sigma-70 family)
MAVARPEPAAGDRSESVAELFKALEAPLLGYALRLVPDADMAQDIVQEAFLRLHGQFDQVRTPRSWLYRTVHNLALNHRRDTAKIVPLSTEETGEAPAPAEAVDLAPLPDEQIARWEGIGLVRLGLQNLDARSRQLLELKFNQGLSYKEISVITGLTVGHVGYVLHHALKALAAELTKAGLLP